VPHEVSGAALTVIETCVHRNVRCIAVCAENSDSAIMVMKAAKNGARGDGTEAFNCPMKRGILVQTAMAPRCIVVGGKLAKGPAQMCLPEHVMWSRHSRRIVPISLSAYPFCHGEPGAMGLSRMPMARIRRVTTAP
jgi:hypothetical protein